MATRYHYCSYEIFKKIITNKTLRLSDMRQSNDLYEMNLFLKQHEGIGSLSSYYDDNADNGFWRDLERYMIEITNNVECFASCLSIGADKLSQWERYGDKCKGLAIGFSEEKLQSYIYSLANILSDFNKNDDCLNFVKLSGEKISYKKLLSVSYPHEIWEKCGNEMNYFKECAFTKDIGFREEKEFRLALIFSKDKKDFLEKGFDKYVKDKNLDDSDSKNKRYIDLEFKSDIIQEVYIGPLSELLENEIKNMLTNNGINCTIKKSTIPYNPSRQKI